MALQFPCPHCNRLLRVSDEAAGRQAQCPNCETIFTIPSRGPAPPSGQPPPSVPPPPSGPPPGAPSGGGGYPPYSFAPISPPPGVGPSAPSVEFQPNPLYLGDVFNRTWNIFKSQWGLCVGVMVLYWLLGFAVNFFGGIINVFIPILGTLIAGVFGIWLGCGLGLFFLKMARGRRAKLGDLFTGTPYFIPVFVAQLLLGLMTVGITLVGIGLPVAIGLAIDQEEVAALFGLCGGIPTAIVLVLLWLIFSQFFWGILDRNVGPIEALRLSAMITRGNRFTLFVFYLLLFFIGLLGLLACGIGIFVTGPFCTLSMAVAYLRMTGQPTAGMEGVPGHPGPSPGGLATGYPPPSLEGSYPGYPASPAGGSYPGYPPPPDSPGSSAPPPPP